MKWLLLAALAITGCKKKREPVVSEPVRDPKMAVPAPEPKLEAPKPEPVVEPPKSNEPALPKSDPAAKVEKLIDDVRPMLTSHYGAVIRWVKASYIRRDGTLDPKYGELEIHTAVSPDVVDDPNRPIGAPAPKKPATAERSDCPSLTFTGGAWKREVNKCLPGEAVSMRCTFADIWEGAIRDRRAPPTALAVIERDNDPDAWFFTIEDEPRKIKIETNQSDTCKK